MFSIAWNVNIAVVCCSILTVVFAYGIHNNQKWSTNFFGYILGLIFVIQFPMGTFIGVYTLWILVQYNNNNKKRITKR